MDYSEFPEEAEKTNNGWKKKKTDGRKQTQAKKGKKTLPWKVEPSRMGIANGKSPANDTYGYVVYAGEGTPQKEYPFEVLRNDTLIQAVKSSDGKVVGAVFYDKRTSLKSNGMTLAVSAPCTVLIEQTASGSRIAVTDALMDQNCKKIDVTWNGKIYSLNMPEGQWCGKPAVYIDKD